MPLFHFSSPHSVVRWRGGLRALGWALFAAFLAFTTLSLLLHYVFWPKLPRYTPEIEAAASKALGIPVRIGKLEAKWWGLNPAFTLSDVRLLPPPALKTRGDTEDGLALARVDGVLSWKSLLTLWRGEPRFSLLALERPALRLKRNADGQFFVAGIPVETNANDEEGRGLAWLLAQKRIRIRDALLVWEDEQRQAPPLILEDVQIELQNIGNRHRFGLSAQPPDAWSSRLELRGDLEHDDADGLASVADWQGTLYGRLDRADLAVWRAWIDYPVALPAGRGGIRFWLTHDQDRWQSLADLALADLRLRLDPALPELALARLQGRLGFTHAPDRLEFATHNLTLLTRDGVSVPPLTLNANWQPPAETGKTASPSFALLGRGALNSNLLDLAALSRLAGYLPLPEKTRQLLVQYSPRGRVQQLETRWQAEGDVLKNYQLSARFDDLGLTAHGVLPGAEGLNGEVELNETGGQLTLDSQRATLSLPAVFAEPDIPFTRLQAKIDWTPYGQPAPEGVEVHIRKLEFKSPHADGKLAGRYRSVPDAPGIIDLDGSLSRAQGAAVWRYLPKVVHADTPHWLQRALVSGFADQVTLKLSGDLVHFPFRDPKDGVFRITAKAHDVVLDYAPGWPVIRQLDADLAFGAGMKIVSRSGTILGTQIENVEVGIADFADDPPLLTVRGQVGGKTGQFLNFIEASPVAERIGHFTEDLRAEGEGKLALALDIPLTHPEAAQVSGHFRIAKNRIRFLVDLPAATEVSGDLAFTRDQLTIPGFTGQFLGQPMRLSGATGPDGVRLKASGGLTANALKQGFSSTAALPAVRGLLDAVSGQTNWQAEITLREASDFVLSSSLQGLSLNLPPPFAKRANETWALHLKKSMLESHGSLRRERLDLRLGQVLKAALISRQEGRPPVRTLERGIVAIGTADAPIMPPATGIEVIVNAPQLDLDAWREKLSAAPPSARAEKNEAALPLNRIALNAETLRLYGRRLTDVQLRATPGVAADWRILVASREALGEIDWNASEKGRLVAHLKRLHLSPDAPEEGLISPRPPVQAEDDNLPAMMIEVEDFRVGTRALGRLDLLADNRGGRWNLRKIEIDNPDGHLEGAGVWAHSPADGAVGDGRTELEFELTSPNAGRLLGRLGQANIVQGGLATLSGKLSWNDSPIRFDADTLSGALVLRAEKGQFSKVEPGVGKLLGLLSLNSITRRLSLDFRDIFSQGLAFDRIAADLAIDGGVIRTQGDLTIAAPSSEVRMRGKADMKTETQDLRVTVTPELGGVAAMGAALINPVAGAAALIAQNLLNNPINKAFRLHYRVSGSWEAPVVERVNGSGDMMEFPLSSPLSPPLSSPLSPPSPTPTP